MTGGASPISMRAPGGRAASAGGRRAAALAAALAAAPCLVLADPAAAALVFREVETVERAGATAVRQVRQVTADGESCRILQEESADPAAPTGTYLLVTPNDAFVVDPARATLAPLAPTRLEPADGAPEPDAALVTAVTLDVLLDEPGPQVLGLPTRHAVHRLRYFVQAPDAAPGAIVRHEERHETWSATARGLDEVPPGWRAWRVAEDAGAAGERRELRDALDLLQARGLVLRHLVERRVGASAEAAPVERVTREVTAVAETQVTAETFQRPDGYEVTEFLAPPLGAPESEPPAPDGAGSGGG